MHAAATHAVTATGLVKNFGDTEALRGIDLEIERATVLGVLGPNGAGKTTMIRALMGLVRLDSGGGRVFDLDIVHRPLDVRQRVGFVPEDECLFPGVSGIEFVAYAGELVGMGRGDALQRAHEVLDYTELGEARYRRVESYSTGMKQRLKIASAIVHDPRLVVLDEPTNGMDPAGRVEVLELARDLARRKGMSLIFSSHLLPDVEAVCDHVIVIGRGRLLAQGAVAELTRTERPIYQVRVKGPLAPFADRLRAMGCTVGPSDEHLHVELPAGASTGLVWSAARAAGEQVRLLGPLRNSLEEVFLKAVSELD